MCRNFSFGGPRSFLKDQVSYLFEPRQTLYRAGGAGADIGQKEYAVISLWGRLSRGFAACILFLGLGVVQFGWTAAGARPFRSEVTVLRAARMLDPKSGKVIEKAVVIVEGETIKAVGSDLAIPAGASVIDLGNTILLPGLIDSHTHLLENFDGELGDYTNMLRTVATLSAAQRALLGAAMGREALEAGITTARDVGNSGWNGDAALRDAIAAGWVVGPRLLVSTRALASVGGQFGALAPHAKNLIEQDYVTISGVEEARKAVRQAFYDGADLIKVIVNSGPRMLSQDEMNAIVEEAHRVGRKVAAHATANLSTRIAAKAGVDSIEHGYTIPDDVLKIMAAKHIYLVPIDFPQQFYMVLAAGSVSVEEQAQRRERVGRTVESHRERLARAIRMGVPIAFGSDEYYEVPGHTRGEASLLALETYQASGMSPLAVLRAATINAADLLGLADRLGTIEAGKVADIIAVAGDPLKEVANLKHLGFVMKVVVLSEITLRHRFDGEFNTVAASKEDYCIQIGEVGLELAGETSWASIRVEHRRRR